MTGTDDATRPASRVLFACGTDNDGYPTCEGDGSACGPNYTCTRLDVTGEATGRAAGRDLFRQIVSAELDNWAPNASQRLLYRASCALNISGVPDPAAAIRKDCGPERSSHALVADWKGGVYVYQCASCFRLYRA